MPKQIITLLLFLLTLPFVSFAAETRGLRVVAKDPATNQSSDVKLYNKSYAVIIGIDKYRNLTPDRQLKNAVRDAKGIESTLRKQYHFDKIIPPHEQQPLDHYRLKTHIVLKAR